MARERRKTKESRYFFVRIDTSDWFKRYFDFNFVRFIVRKIKESTQIVFARLFYIRFPLSFAAKSNEIKV